MARAVLTPMPPAPPVMTMRLPANSAMSHDRAGQVLLVGRAPQQPVIPGAQMRHVRTVEIHVEPAMQMWTPWDVGQRQHVPGKVRVFGKLRRHHAPDARRILDALLDRDYVD